MAAIVGYSCSNARAAGSTCDHPDGATGARSQRGGDSELTALAN